MRLTTRGKYAVTALLDLSLNESGNKFISISQIALRQDISVSYLEQLFRNLRKAGIVQAARGPGGGYRLSRPSTEINVSEVVASVEDKMDATQCGGASDCHSGNTCLAHDLWTELNDQVDSFLLNKSLEDVIANKRTSFARKQEGLIARG
ncbi:MAG: Rrf2 family transcriptional regulator [SAR86 cluster bacterium]|jgi:Rrf2 family iron-sulfur cluster assembly transcriptional regulator|nr:Rrf2 family transcriptional regulator [SAR86 cluster bacterium]